MHRVLKQPAEKGDWSQSGGCFFPPTVAQALRLIDLITGELCMKRTAQIKFMRRQRKSFLSLHSLRKITAVLRKQWEPLSCRKRL